MGAFNSQQRPPITIQDQPGWDKGEWIRIKGVVTAADFKKMNKQTITQGANGKPSASSEIDEVAMMQCMIEDWVLFGDNNIPVDLYEGRERRKRIEIIAKLPTEYMLPVINACTEIAGRNQVQQPQDFTNSVSEPTPTNSEQESASQTL